MFEKSGALPNVRLFGVEFCQMTFHSNVHIFPCFTNINTTFSLLNAYFAWYSVANIIPATTDFVIFVLGWEAFFVKALVAIERVCLYNESLEVLSRCFDVLYLCFQNVEHLFSTGPTPFSLNNVFNVHCVLNILVLEEWEEEGPKQSL